MYVICYALHQHILRLSRRVRVVVVLSHWTTIFKKLKVMRKLVKLKAKWRSLEMHHNDGVWVVLSLSQSPLLSPSRVHPARYVAALSAAGNESTHLGVAAIFQSYLCSLFRWLNFFIKHALGAVGWRRGRVKYRLPVPVRLQVAPVLLLQFQR